VRRLIALSEAHAVLDRRLDRGSAAPLVIALSGGGDSMALLFLMREWTQRFGRELLALTVDHGLSPESGAWTAFAGEAATRAGVAGRGLAWTGDKPSTGLPAAARVARHKLLADAARDAGAAVILMAHTADDIVEGDAMRAAGAPTLGYLREWSPSPVWPQGRDIFILRPLLTSRRAALRDWLRARDLAWLEDPSNDDPRFARARARAALAHRALVPQPRDRRAAGAEPLRAFASAVESDAQGALVLTRAGLPDDPTLRRRFLATAAICASGRSAPPRGAVLHGLADRLTAESTFVATLAGARISVDAAKLTVSREPGEIARSNLAPLKLRSGEVAVWDGRFEIVANRDLTVAALSGHAAKLGKTDRAGLSRVSAAIRPALPVLLHDGEISLPHPMGPGPARTRALCRLRFDAACGLLSHERDISRHGIAQDLRSSYVEALALA
jgi:tRNA(Ile)-lysidine synthase